MDLPSAHLVDFHLFYLCFSIVKFGTGSKTGSSLPVLITKETELRKDSFDPLPDDPPTFVIIGSYSSQVQTSTIVEQPTLCSYEGSQEEECALDHASV